MDPVSLQASVSLIANNLVCSDTYLAYVNNIKPNPQVHIISFEDLKSGNPTSTAVKHQNEDEVLHLNYVNIRGKWYLVIGYMQNFQIWNESGSRMMGCLSQLNFEDRDPSLFFVGSCAYELNKSILVGNSKGVITILELFEREYNSFIVNGTISTNSREAVAVICCYKTNAIVCSETGKSTFLDLANNMEVAVMDFENVTATVGTSLKKYAVIGYGNGEVRVFNLKDKNLLCRIWSHSRWVSGIGKYCDRPIFVTCGEDGFINAWALRKREVEIVGSKEYQNTLLTGVCANKDFVFSVAYDRAKLIVDNLF